MRAAAIASRTQGQSRNAQRERNIGIGGTEAKIAAQAQMPVHGAQCVKERRVARQLRGGSVADLGDREGKQSPALRGARLDCSIGALDRVFNGAMQGDLQARELLSAGGAEID